MRAFILRLLYVFFHVEDVALRNFHKNVQSDDTVFIYTHGYRLNGFIGLDRAYWRTFGHRLVSWDLPGHGKSRHGRYGQFSLWQSVFTLLWIIQQQKEAKVILVGHSVGCLVNIIASAVLKVFAPKDAGKVMCAKSVLLNPAFNTAHNVLHDVRGIERTLKIATLYIVGWISAVVYYPVIPTQVKDVADDDSLYQKYIRFLQYQKSCDVWDAADSIQCHDTVSELDSIASIYRGPMTGYTTATIYFAGRLARMLLKRNLLRQQFLLMTGSNDSVSPLGDDMRTLEHVNIKEYDDAGHAVLIEHASSNSAKSDIRIFLTT